VSIIHIAVSDLTAVKPHYAVRDTPAFSLGAASDASSEWVYRVVGVLLLQEGDLAIGTMGTRDIAIYDGEGRLRRRLGRPGEGPGEFRSIDALFHVPPDRVGVWDARLGRITVFDHSGRTTSSVPDGVVGFRRTVFAGVSTRGLVGIGTYPLARDMGTTEGVRRDSLRLTFHSVSSDSALPNSECLLPGDESYFLMARGVSSTIPVPFGAITRVVVVGEEIAYTAVEEGEIRLLTSACGLRSILRFSGQPAPVTDSTMRFIRDSLRARASAMIMGPAKMVGEWLNEAANRTPIRPYYPLFEDVRADTEGGLWIELAAPYRERGRHSWIRIARDRSIAFIRGPSATTRILAVSLRAVVALQVDDTGVEHVLLFPLHATNAS
jgi:hypothetical protein